MGIMAIILAINGFSVLTGEPKGKSKEENSEEHYETRREKYHFNWRESAEVVGVINKVEYQHLDAEDLPFTDNSFDAIFMLDTLQHIKHKEKALKECIRVTRSKGIVDVYEMSEEGIKYCQKEFGFKPDLVIPMNYLKGGNEVSVEVVSGKLVNAYILRKI
jgi:SAM-dependent methyltransferase